MGLRGDLETFMLASILQLLHHDRKTGALQVKNKEHWVSVIFQEGQIVYAMSSYRQVRLGNLLREDGAITQEQLEQCLAEGKERKEALGKVLMEKGYISLLQLSHFIRQQVEEIIYRLFFWETGVFEYEDTRLNLAGLVLTNLDVMEVLLEASRRIDEMSVLMKQIPSSEMVFKQTGKLTQAEAKKLAPEENRLLRLVDGNRSVEGLLEDCSLSPFEGYRVLHSLLLSGAVEKVYEVPAGTAAPKAKTPPAQPINNSSQEEYTALINSYTNILQMIWQSLEPELGKETATLFTSCIPQGKPGQKDLFNDFSANNPGPTNAFNIEANLKLIKDVTNIRVFLVESFNRFILNILDRVPTILGVTPTLNTLVRIETHLPHISRYMADLKITNSISDDIQRIIEIVRHQIDGKNKKKRS